VRSHKAGYELVEPALWTAPLSWANGTGVLTRSADMLQTTDARQQEPLIVKRYYGVSFVLSILALAAWMTGRFAYHAPAASDGSGPDGGGLLLLFGAVLVGCLLVHSTLLSLAVWKYRSPSVFGGRWGLAIHTVFWIAFVARLNM
jgi:hypothetical protein